MSDTPTCWRAQITDSSLVRYCILQNPVWAKQDPTCRRFYAHHFFPVPFLSMLLRLIFSEEAYSIQKVGADIEQFRV